MQLNPDNIGIIVLAAGYSRRFLGDKRKALLPDQRTVLEATLQSVPAGFTKRILVLHPGDDALAELAQGWRIVIADKAAAGMGESLAAGIRAAADWEGALIALADMPFIAPFTFEAVRRALLEHDIVVPVYTGQRGHPVGFVQKHFSQLAGLSGDSGARIILNTHAEEVHEMPCDDEGVLRDIDTAADITEQKKLV